MLFVVQIMFPYLCDFEVSSDSSIEYDDDDDRTDDTAHGAGIACGFTVVAGGNEHVCVNFVIYSVYFGVTKREERCVH